MSNTNWYRTHSYGYGVLDSCVNNPANTSINDNSVEGQAIDLLRSARDNWTSQSLHINETSAIIDSIDVEMQDIARVGYGAEIYVVIDTNILISHLTVLKDLTTLLQSTDRSQIPVVLLIPGIVIAELDYQKDSKREVAPESRKASKWLAKEIRNGQGIIKGQAYSQTLLPSGDWRERTGLSNDELILDCCKYYTRIKEKDVRLCTNDNNLVIQAAANGDDLFSCDASVAILRPTSSTWDCFQLLQQLIPGYTRPSIHAIGRDFQRDAEGYDHRAIYSSKLAPDSPIMDDADVDMDTDINMDMDFIQASRSSSQGRDHLHRCIVSELQSHVRKIVGKATQLQRRRQKTESRYSLANTTFRGDLPTEEDWTQNWSIRECLRYLAKILPPKLERSHLFEEGDASSLSDFLSLPGERGARPGREWSKTDWIRELVKISQLAQDYDYEGLDKETLYNYQCYVFMFFKDNSN